MSISTVKKVLLVLLVVWVGTLAYIYFPDIVPDFLHLRDKSPLARDLKLSDGIETVFSAANRSQPAPNEPKDKAIHIVISSDNKTLGGMIALLNSIVSNTKSLLFFHLITNTDTSKHLKAWITGSRLRDIKYEIVKFPEDWVAGKIKVRGGRAELANPLNYARYYLPRLFPHIEGRVVYIDDDCIVQGDIEELYQMKFRPGTLAAFSDDCIGMNKRITFMQNVYADFFDLKNEHFKELNILPSACSFNTGVFVTNLADWRAYNITQQLEHWLVLNTKEELYGNEKGGGGSQPPMMLAFYRKYTSIELLWHVHFLGWSTKPSLSRQIVKSAKLLHWNGHYKPWERTAAYQDVWDHYYLPDPTKQFQPVRKGII